MTLVRSTIPFAVLAFGAVLAVPGSVRAAEPVPTFNRDIRPLLSDRCFVCHGPDAGTPPDLAPTMHN